MFIELTEILRCPRSHEDSYVICVPITMDGRSVMRGVVSCPACGTDYPVLDGVLLFDPESSNVAEPSTQSELTAEAAQTFSGIGGPGGYLLTIGNAGRLVPQLAGLLAGTQIVALNPPAGIAAAKSVSIVRTRDAVPLKLPSVRAVIVGSDVAMEPWLSQAALAVLPGLRVVVEKEDAEVPSATALARGVGVSVFERRTR